MTSPMRRLLLLALIALPLASCPKPAKAKNVVIEELPKDPYEQAKKTLDTVYRAIEALDPEKMEAVLAPDVVAFGLGPNDFYTDRTAVIEELRREFIPFNLRGDQLKVFWTRPRIALDDSGEGGWLHDLPRFQRLRDSGRDQFWSLRLTAHFIRQGPEHYVIDAMHLSMGFPDTELYADKADRKLNPPMDLGEGGNGKGTSELLDLTKKMLADIGVKVDHTSDLDEVALIGTDVADVFEGGAAFKALVKPRLAELKKSNAGTYAIEGNTRARLSPGGNSAWLAATVVLTVKEGKKDKRLPPFRALWIFEKEKGFWNLVSDHQSLGLKMEQREPVSRADLPLQSEMKLSFKHKEAPNGFSSTGFTSDGGEAPSSELKSSRSGLGTPRIDSAPAKQRDGGN